MTHRKTEVARRSMMALVLIAFSILGWLVAPRPAATQNSQAQQQVQQSVNEMKESAARNKQALAQYRWQQQEIVTVKGKQKKQDLFQVELQPDGRQLRTPIAQDPDSSSSESQHQGLKRKLTEKKTGELVEYAGQIKNLAQSYIPPDPTRLQQAYQQGNVSIGAGGAAGEVRLVVHDYVKPGDTVTFSLNRKQKEILGIEVSSYLNDPKDTVTLNAQFERLPDGTNYISEMLVNGVSKQLTVTIKNFNFQKM